MTQVSNNHSAHTVLIFAFSALVAMGFVLLPMPVMLEHFIYEDMFYYLRVAQNIVAGNGSAFDGLSPTNGYHRHG